MENIAVIGAGMAGLSAARDLAAAGVTVTVFDKSRGVGGRLATRRTDAGAFNHGAPQVQGDRPGFDSAMESLGNAAVRTGGGWSGVPGMSSLLKPWIADVTRVAQCRIVSVTDRDGVHLTDEDGRNYGPFDGCIVAIPAPQVADLFPHMNLSRVTMRPGWVLMASWDRAIAVPDAPVQPFSAVSAQTTETWVAHATPEWSEAHLELDKDDVATRLSDALCDWADLTPPTFAIAHRWRYARVGTSLGAPFLSCGLRILAGGDWALGPLAGDAWQSGREMAADFLQRRVADTAPPR